MWTWNLCVARSSIFCANETWKNDHHNGGVKLGAWIHLSCFQDNEDFGPQWRKTSDVVLNHIPNSSSFLRYFSSFMQNTLAGRHLPFGHLPFETLAMQTVAIWDSCHSVQLPFETLAIRLTCHSGQLPFGTVALRTLALLYIIWIFTLKTSHYKVSIYPNYKFFFFACCLFLHSERWPLNMWIFNQKIAKNGSLRDEFSHNSSLDSAKQKSLFFRQYK